MRISPVKPGGPVNGSIRSLPLRDGVVLEFLSWRGDEYIAALKFPSGRVKLLAGKAGDSFDVAHFAAELDAAEPQPTRHGGVYQWSLEVPESIAKETKAPPRAYLWIPEGTVRARGIVAGNDNMLEEPLFNEPEFRAALSRADVALMIVYPGFQGLNMAFSRDEGKVVIDTINRFKVEYNRRGLPGYRAREIVFAAEYPDDGEFQRFTQQAIMRFSRPKKSDGITHWYIREGSATVDNAGNLLPLPLPANSAPAPVTVCAWQWGEVEPVFFSVDLH